MTSKTTRPNRATGALREFHVSREVREVYGFDESLFAVSGNLVFADFHAAKTFAHRLNERRPGDQAFSASEIYALGLIDEALHLLISRHRREVDPGLWSRAISVLEEEVGTAPLDELLGAFTEAFPPTPVYRNEKSAAEYLAGETGGESHREAALEELTLLWLANRNPAFAPYRELFDDEGLRGSTAYGAVVHRLEAYLAVADTAGPISRTLLDILLAPVRAAPDSLQGQLEFIRTTWAELLGPDLHRVLGGLDFLAEEHRAWFPAGPGPVEPPDYRVLAETGERYSADRDWMPRLVLLAKNAHVWLAQLSSKHGREIATLDSIPDTELERLAGWGITGLWLIGVWQRSRASERIKRRMGDQDAVASAYSLEDYRIADALGGEAAYEDLRGRARRHGIRLSTDMVPNHMGIDSRWVIEHPDWFLSLDHAPYPGYSFNGPDLSDDERVGVFIEDHYWDRSDAAVVFKRLDRETGDERFIYHGNDGTSMPWNDTAQLDYLKAEVREAVIQTILAVARRSPVIRFDAAMTLARQHFHRLWFPEPGAAGAVPSRAEHSMTREAFDCAMPREFWREVVDRVAEEAPDTLLLAEAFWLLEGYFVRTLGMHRVYNSAFMNMLRDERNAEYRQLIRSTLEFDPQILKRYVNFMSNPDERTAVDQFGTGDKYFGVAALMATMPGLPMFGHGQIEGLAEKYGMEFRRPRWDEAVNEGLVWRHELQIFPLLRRRHLFAEVDRFVLYDFVTDDGSVDENVFAYSNDNDGERSLIVYNNRDGETRGRLELSTAVAQRGEGDAANVVRTSLADGLRLPEGDGCWLIYGDLTSGLEHLASCDALRADGWRFELDAYRLCCFFGFREVTEDAEHPWRDLDRHLGGGGVRSIDDAIGQLRFAVVLEPFRVLVAPDLLERLAEEASSREGGMELLEAARSQVAAMMAAASVLEDGVPVPSLEDAEMRTLTEIEALFEMAEFVRSAPPDLARPASWMADLGEALEDPVTWATALAWIVVRHLAGDGPNGDEGDALDARFAEWHLRSTLLDLVVGLGRSEDDGRRACATVELMLAVGIGEIDTDESGGSLASILARIAASDAGQEYLRVNTHAETLWFNREALEELARWLLLAKTLDAVVAESETTESVIAESAAEWQSVLEAARDAGYRLADFRQALIVSGDAVTVDD
jgi:glycosidase